MYQIKTGFLSGNLSNESFNEIESAKKLAKLIENALESAFPDAEITVNWQEATGCIPYDCKTRVFFDEDDRDEDEIIQRVDSIVANCSEEYDKWFVK